MGIGKTGQYGHPDVLAAGTKTIQMALKGSSSARRTA
jgi:hypothetical protein